MDDPLHPFTRTPQFHASAAVGAADSLAELVQGLQAPQARIAPKYFYDQLGSALFGAITALDEYYPTRTEAAILATHQAAIARSAGSGRTLIDLGAGDGQKAGRLFGALQPRRYVAVDISADYLREALERLQRAHPTIEMHGVGLDFTQSLALPAALTEGALTLFYPGSSIGNFTPDEALAFLRRLRTIGDDLNLVIGIDLVKDKRVLDAAYDDALGVTAAFNLNLLRHVNRVLGSDFELRDWQHVACFEPAASRIEMHLQARRALTARWPGGERRFAAGERIHTEYSYKYRPADIEAMLHAAGFAQSRCWTDERDWFAVLVAG